MGKIIKFLKRKWGKGFTFLVVPNSPGNVKSLTIPFSVALVVAVIVVFNIYIFWGYTHQIWQIYSYKKSISYKNSKIADLRHEQKEVRPALERSYNIIADLNRIKKERETLQNTWKSIQQNKGRL